MLDFDLTRQEHKIKRQESETTPAIEEEELVKKKENPDIQQLFYNKIRIDEVPEDAEVEDLDICSQLLVKSMIIREKYMMLSLQSFPYTTAKYLNKVFTEERESRETHTELFDNKYEGRLYIFY